MDPLAYYEHPEMYDRVSRATPLMAAFYRDVIREQGGPVLELACGTGRLTIPFALDGVDITGMDLAPAMLRVAREKAAAAGARVGFVAGDMRRFRLSRRFGVIFIPFNSLLHLQTAAEIRECFGRVREHLVPGGVFAFDVFNPHVAKLAREPGVRFTEGTIEDSLGTLVLESSPAYDAGAQVNRSTRYISSPEQKDILVVPLHLRCIFPQELPLLLELAGLRLDERYGDFERSAFEGSSNLQVVIARNATPS
jgi:SAM-dependent methyltransferase